MRVALSEVLGALSYALDLTEGEPPGHAVRTTAIGMRLAEQIGLSDEERSSLFYALLLKDAGCSANAARLSSLFGADDHQTKRAMKMADWSKAGSLALYTWRAVAPGAGPLAKARQMRRLTQEDEVTRELIGTRCERGAQIARMLELPEDTAQAIRALDEHWDGSGQPLGLRGEEIPLFGRILCLAQTVEVFVRTVGLRGALGMALKRRGRWFDPALVDALLSVRDDRAFWAPLEDPRCVPPVAAWEPADRVLSVGDDRLDRVADAFAQVIDAKSPFTARHSAEVARWAVEIGSVLEMRDEELRDLRRAGLLHDTSASSQCPAGSSTSPGGWKPTRWPRSASTRATRSRSSSAWRACAGSWRPPRRITSGWTAGGTTAVLVRPISPAPRGSSPWPTSTRR
jgi:HD-GYP domain-containing protein (c-di-GMP phosphodiesterase class II)